MICKTCGNLLEDCECERESSLPIDFGDDERVWGYDGDTL
jgi:hypothetical protein